MTLKVKFIILNLSQKQTLTKQKNKMKTQYTRFEKSILQSISNLMDTKNPISFDALELYYKLAHQTKQNAAERTKKQANYYHSK